MKVIGPDEIRRRVGAAQAIAAMRDAVLDPVTRALHAAAFWQSRPLEFT